MKRNYSSVLLVLLIALLLPYIGLAEQQSAAAEDFYYYSDGKKIILPVSTENIAVKFKKGISNEKMRFHVEAEPEIESFSQSQELDSPEFVLLKVKMGVQEVVIMQLLNSFSNKTDVEFSSPVFQFSDARMVLTNEFIVKFKEDAILDDIERLNREQGVEVVKKGLLREKGYILKVIQGAGKNALDIANIYHNNPLVEYAHPNFLRLLKPPAAPNDPYFNNQWNLNNTGQNGWTVDADIDAPEAWDIHIGSAGITIAIIDEGVDLTHEDLLANLVAGYDATGQGSGGGPNSWDGHGTSCAGIASAVTDNAMGVAGVNWDVKIMPVRIAYSPTSCKGCYWITYDSWMADGITWAVDNGADVLSNSWGGGSPSTTITNAIIYAKTNGRAGKGSVVVFASGNSNGAVIYPATRPEVIAVGATSPCDERKSPTSCDGEYWWGSNYGAALDVVAPGVKIYTTDIMSSGGYTSGNYITDFNGTSSATPHVAGLAGLVLSVDSSLTASQVESVIYTTADDLGTPGWDQYLGYGRINAYKALLALSPVPVNISGAISYAGIGGGTIYVLAYTNPKFSGTHAYSTTISAPGSYTISNVASGTYYILSYRDYNGNGNRQLNEPYGLYGSPGSPTAVVVSGGSVTGIDVTLYDPGSVSGVITYTGSTTGTIYIDTYTSSSFSGPPVYRTQITAPGSYTFIGLLPGTYYVRSFRDANGNRRLDIGEPRGRYGAPSAVVVNAGSKTTGINITLY